MTGRTASLFHIKSISGTMQIGVVGASECDKSLGLLAEETGRLIAESGAVLICGGRGGVMEAACRGAAECSGTVVGILPGTSPGNRFLGVSVRTGLGIARNAVIVHSSDAVIAIGGSNGTLSEIAMALKEGTEVFGILTWEIPGVVRCKSPAEAVSKAVFAAGHRT